ncbi:hypothetical protein BES34_014235 [Leptospira inadai serovar Lyme]|uniref:DUF4942 domain-containing protein n=1 Tax=Leptospira inadai serovar Lyme TaxID=293084 RepID=A0ABX4YGJ0_9LEPT|nr:hypothetical protein BES34_014235 [Leptospira inadai serovar Lyme]
MENEYFQVKSYLDGKCHVTFKRPDLVDQANKIIARHFKQNRNDGEIR